MSAPTALIRSTWLSPDTNPTLSQNMDFLAFRKEQDRVQNLPVTRSLADVATVLDLLSQATHDTAVEILSLPDRIRGYGPVKENAVKEARARREQFTADLANPPPAPRQIAAE